MSVPVIVILGPTAVGKTAFAVEVARMLDTEIISADSMQVYRGMSIGVAAPSEKELAAVRHHFIGVLDPNEHFNAADFARQALEIVRDLDAKGKTPVVAGGSGLYVRALVDGIFPGPTADTSIRHRLKDVASAKGCEYLHEQLRAVDPAAAASIHPNDLRRVVRALEVYELTGLAISELQEKHKAAKPDLDATFIGLERERLDLYERIDERVERMIELGLMDEVADLLKRGYEEAIDRIRPLGYPELKGYLLGEYDLDHAKYLIKRNTRRYAKRQHTWFRADPRVRWFRFGRDEEAADYAAQICRAVGLKSL